MAHAAAALLDELMGRNRNLRPDDANRNIRWDSEDVCKHFLVQYCPHELFINTRSDLGPCTKLHDDELRKAYQESSRYRKMGYEEAFLSCLEQIMQDVERRIRRGHSRLALNNTSNSLHTPLKNKNEEKIKLLTEKINDLLEQVEQLGCDGKVEEAEGTMKLVDQLKDEREQLRVSVESIASQEKQMEVCQVCAAFLIIGDAKSRVDEHLMGKQHMGYAKIKATIDEIKKEQRRPIEELEAKRQKEREEREKEREREREERQRKREEREKEREKEKEERQKRKEKERRDRRSRSRSRDRRRRSRSRDRRRSRSRDRKRRSRSRDRDRERDRDRRRRSRSRDRRRRSRSRSRERRRSRSRSRSKKRYSRSRSRDRRRSRSRDRRKSRDRSDRDRERSREKEVVKKEQKEVESEVKEQENGLQQENIPKEETLEEMETLKEPHQYGEVSSTEDASEPNEPDPIKTELIESEPIKPLQIPAEPIKTEIDFEVMESEILD
ncbi:luc7-like protein 3 [Anneissia japonica]|uniref:luc7-like protein 3 n=1 Tax=Anneissia japonica TaxID=1529436 RepID=UPI001425B1D7|nr:luc7-like protein 3 [Anneissia japonica]